MLQNEQIDDTLLRAADSFGTPAYVYFTAIIDRRVREVRETFGGRFALSFAAKANPNPSLLRWLQQRTEFLDVSSIGELRLGLSAGWDPVRVSFTGPAKREAEIREAIENGVGQLVLESVREALLVDRVAQSLGAKQNVMIRIAPARVPKGFGDQMAGKPSAFGIDLEAVDHELPTILGLKCLRVVGLHIYSGTQCLKAEAICENYRIFIDIFREICRRYSLQPQKLVFGSGLGISYHNDSVALNLNEVARGIIGDLDRLKEHRPFKDTRLVLELGRYLVGDAGFFVTKVVSTKQSRGVQIGICDGGMNNHLAAAGHFGMVIQRNYKMHVIGGGLPTERINLVGPLCTSIDRLANNVLLPPVKEGDLIAVHASGAYGLTASPIHFISHAAPREVLVDDGNMHDVSRLF